MAVGLLSPISAKAESGTLVLVGHSVRHKYFNLAHSFQTPS